ncbi:MAG: SGNH/GDSL hydrolase family protein [Gemmatimonadota bacterium]
MTVVPVLALALWAACGSSPAAPGGNGGDPPDEAALAVLFVGNSLTFTNDLPSMLERMLADAGADPDVRSVAFPNFGLQDHWAEGTARALIAQSGWDLVIMQQGPSATEGRPSLLEFSGLFASEIRAAGAVPALYMVWPAEARSFDFPGVEDSYAAAADAVEGYLFPAGSAWLAAWDRDPGLPLYGPDAFHPSALGSYLAALTMLGQLTEVDLTGLPDVIPAATPVPIDAAVQDALADAAAAANAEWARAPRP